MRLNIDNLKFNTQPDANTKPESVENVDQVVKTTILPNIQTQNTLANGLKVDLIELESSKVQFEKPPDQEISLKSFSGISKHNLFWPVIILIVALVFIAGAAGFNRYITVNANYKDEQKNCQNILEKYAKDGVPASDITCPDKKLSFTDYFSAINYIYTANNQTMLNTRKNALENQIQDLNLKITQIQAQLNLLEVDSKSLITSTEPIAQLDQQLAQKTSEAQMYTGLLTTSLVKITDSTNTYTDLIALVTSKNDQQPAQDYLAAYKALTQDQQIQKYPDLQQKIQLLQKQINEQVVEVPPGGSNTFKADPVELAKYKTFSGLGFQALYESHVYTKVLPASDNVTISDTPEASNYIYNFAINRGYKKRQQAMESGLVSFNGQRMQLELQQSLQQLQQEAAKSNLKIGIVSGYRSISDQVDLFKSRFAEASKKEAGRVYTPEEIVAGKADKALDSVLVTTSVPGYSRHHTGYTVDITDSTSKNSFTLFKNTTAYKWISANNFLNAKKFGLIPSYPPGQKQAGPGPEEWEFVWVGTEELLN